MSTFLAGVFLTACLYTFFPAIATIPSGWLRKGWAKLSQKS